MNQDLVSIVIPVYGVEPYLRRCLDSIVAQTYGRLEIICVDDASPDGSAMILAEYARRDPRIRVIRRETNGGLSAARNTGLRVASGKYVEFVDSDDWLDRDYVEKMAEAIESAGTEIAYNDSVCGEGWPCRRDLLFLIPTSGLGQDLKILSPVDALNAFKDKSMVWKQIYRREFLEKAGLEFPEGWVYEDIFFQLASYAHARSIAAFCGPSYHYFANPSGITATTPQVKHIEIFTHSYDYLAEHGLLGRISGFKWPIGLAFNFKNDANFAVGREYLMRISGLVGANPGLWSQEEVDLISFCKENLTAADCRVAMIRRHIGRSLTGIRQKVKG